MSNFKVDPEICKKTREGDSISEMSMCECGQYCAMRHVCLCPYCGRIFRPPSIFLNIWWLLITLVIILFFFFSPHRKILDIPLIYLSILYSLEIFYSIFILAFFHFKSWRNSANPITHREAILSKCFADPNFFSEIQNNAPSESAAKLQENRIKLIKQALNLIGFAKLKNLLIGLIAPRTNIKGVDFKELRKKCQSISIDPDREKELNSLLIFAEERATPKSNGEIMGLAAGTELIPTFLMPDITEELKLLEMELKIPGDTREVFTRNRKRMLILIFLGIFSVFFLWVKMVQNAKGKFHRLIGKADRIVVRHGGFYSRATDKILFEVTDPMEIGEVKENLILENNNTISNCMCFGYPGIDWYKGKDLLAITAMKHGKGFWWEGGAGPLTKESREWLKNWLDPRRKAPPSTGTAIGVPSWCPNCFEMAKKR